MEKYPCPCCGYFTHSEPTIGNHNICPVCIWQDDPYQSAFPGFGIWSK